MAQGEPDAPATEIASVAGASGSPRRWRVRLTVCKPELLRRCLGFCRQIHLQLLEIRAVPQGGERGEVGQHLRFLETMPHGLAKYAHCLCGIAVAFQLFLPTQFRLILADPPRTKREFMPAEKQHDRIVWPALPNFPGDGGQIRGSSSLSVRKLVAGSRCSRLAKQLRLRMLIGKQGMVSDRLPKCGDGFRPPLQRAQGDAQGVAVSPKAPCNDQSSAGELTSFCSACAFCSASRACGYCFWTL